MWKKGHSMLADIHFNKPDDFLEAIKVLRRVTIDKGGSIVIADPNIIAKKVLKTLLQNLGLKKNMNVNGK